MKRLIVTVLMLISAVACAPKGAVPVEPVEGGTSPSSPASPKPSPRGPTPSPAPSEDPGGGGTATYEVWFTLGEHLFRATRSEAFRPGIGKAALAALLEGPTAAESEGGVGTAIPAGTRLLDLNIADGLATVDLSREYESGGGTLSMSMRLGQVVYTLTQFPTVRAVQFRLDGRPVKVFSGEGIILEDPVGRDDYEDLLPPVLVETPVSGERVPNPVTIAGTANVFEATVEIVILDEDGKAIVETFTTATCGTGCRGEFSERVAYDVDHEQRGTIRVMESDPSGGAEGADPYEVSIPVTLTP